MKKILIICMLLFSSLAFADSTGTVFIDLGGYSVKSGLGDVSPVFEDLDSGFHMGISYLHAIGYVGVEGFFKYNSSSLTVSGTTADYSDISVGANVYGILPINSFRAYVFAGVALHVNELTVENTFVSTTTGNMNSFGGQAGAGLDYTFTNFVIGAKAEAFTNNYEDTVGAEVDGNGVIFAIRFGYSF